jgi:hypothetical protein
MSKKLRIQKQSNNFYKFGKYTNLTEEEAIKKQKKYIIMVDQLFTGKEIARTY